MIRFSERAAKHIKNQLPQRGSPGRKALRIERTEEGGIRLGLEDLKRLGSEEVREVSGIPVVVDSGLEAEFSGHMLDYTPPESNGFGQAGFWMRPMPGGAA
ncbi:MAG: hypothetical protein ABII00_16760 [Elusimicrobiota bacterium]